MSTSTRRIRSSPDEVWAVLADPTTYPRWLSGAKAMRWVDPSFPAPGSRFGHEVGAGPVEVDDTTTSLAAEQERSLVLHVRARPLLEAHVRFDLQPDGAGTVVRMSERPTGPFRLVAPVVSPLVRLRNDHSLRRLARLLGDG